MVEKNISLYIRDSSIIDTSSISTYLLDSHNREVQQLIFYGKYSGKIEIEYKDKDTKTSTTTKTHSGDEGVFENFTTIEKSYKRNNLCIDKSYRDGHLLLTTRTRKYKHRTVYRLKRSKNNRQAFAPSKSKYVSILDSQHRKIKEYATFTSFPFHKKHLYVIYTFNGDLIEKECTFHSDKKMSCRIYEYKRGIKLIEK